jgi:predicted metal-dependent hydrolase
MAEIKISELIRSRRRTVELIVTEDARLVVRAPLRTPGGFIEELLEKKRRWIIRKMTEAQSRAVLPPRRFGGGDTLPYLGRLYEIQLVDSAGIYVEFRDGTFRIPKQTAPYAARFVKIWYKKETLKLVGQRCAHFSEIFGYAPKSVRISNAEKRWGSCGPGGTLNFSWKLSMAPPEVVDYLVVHEMAHVLHPNHSRLFWATVESVLPGCGSSRKWLKDNGHLLVV